MTDSLAARPERNLGPAALLIGLTVVGLGLRALGMDDSIVGDELFSYELSTRPGLDDVIDGVASDLEISPPLYFVLAWAFQKLGDPHLWIRVPSLLAGTAAIPLAYALGIRTVGRNAALAGAAVLALSPFAIFYSAEARPYAVTMLFVLLSTLALLSALERDSRGAWALFALATWAALMSHYTAVFVVAAQAGWALWARPEARRRVALVHGIVAVGLLPWLPALLVDRTSGFQTAIENVWPFTFGFFLRSLIGWLVGNPYGYLSVSPGILALCLAAAGVLAAGVAGARSAWQVLQRPEALLILVLALATPIGAALYSVVLPSVFAPRTLLSSLPALCLVLGLLVTSAPRAVAAVGMALLLGGLALGAVRAIDRDPKPPFREAADFIEERGAPRDPILEAIFDYGSLEAEVEPPFRIWRYGCLPAITRSGQVFEKGQFTCTGTPAAFEHAVSAADDRLFLVTPPGAPPPPALRNGWRVAASRTFEDPLIPMAVLEYVRR